MLKTLAEILREHPELALFLALAIGYAIGRLKLFGFTPGAVTGCLLAGVAIGQFGVVISPDVQHAFFLLFLFAIGYRVGPQFIGSFDKDMLPQVYVTLVLCITGLAVSWACARLFGFDVGTAAGMLAGGLTESAAVGTAQGALRALPLPPAQLALMEANLASAFAVAYLAGTIGAIIFLSQIAPRLLPRPLTEACRAIEVELGLVTGDGHDSSARRDIELRAFRLADASKAQTIAQAEARVPAQFRAFILRVRRGDTILDGVPGLQLQVDDIVAVAGQRGYLVEAGVRIGSEVDDIELLDVPSETVDVVLTQRDLVGQTLEQLRQLPEARSIFLRSMTRSGEILPVLPGLRVLRGDIFRIEGSKRHVADAAARIGFADRPGNATDMVYVGVFIVLGGLLGIPALQLGGVDIGLGVAVGVLVGGIVAGWLRSVQRAYGFVPEPTLWVFDSLGLCAFVACVGISAGPRFVDGLVDSGWALVAASLIIVVTSHLAALLVGSRLLKMNEGVLLGTCCGAGTSAAALAAVQTAADSRVPTLGYGVGYALGNVLLALWGTVIVALIA